MKLRIRITEITEEIENIDKQQSEIMDSIRDRIACLNQNRDALKQELDELRRSIMDVYIRADSCEDIGSKEYIKCYGKEHITIGYWDCPDSPILICVYVDNMDCCIICGDPDERK